MWQSRANQILQRNDFAEEASNVDDTDSPDGGPGANNDIHERRSNHRLEQT